MHEIDTILSAVALSDEATRVLETTASIAQNYEGVRTFVAHAVDPVSPSYERMLFPWACLGDDREAIIAELLRSAETIARERFGSSMGKLRRGSLKLTYGEPALALIEEAKQLGPDLIVVGANRAERPTPRLGARARRLASTALVPTLVVRRRAGEPGYQRIAAAIALDDGSPNTMTQTAQFAWAQKADVHAVHVIPTVEHLDHGEAFDKKYTGVPRQVREEVDRRIKQLESAVNLPFPVRTEHADRFNAPDIRSGDPGSQLVAYADEKNVDLLVMQRAGDSGIGSLRLGRTAAYVAEHAKCDVLLLPPTEPSAA